MLDDQPFQDINRLNVPFSPLLDQSEVEEEAASEDDDAKAEEASVVEVVARAKSPTLNDQVLDLIEENGDVVSKSTSPNKVGASEAEVIVAEKSSNQTLLEINVEIAAEKNILVTEADSTPTAKMDQPENHTDTQNFFSFSFGLCFFFSSKQL